VLLTTKWSPASVFMVAAVAAMCAALAAFSLSRIAGLGGSGKDAAARPASVEVRLRRSTTAGA
jgi:AAHS family 4-hydroxybenzoate transporter-like MFS transporter